jgi:hypothetical protein
VSANTASIAPLPVARQSERRRLSALVTLRDPSASTRWRESRLLGSIGLSGRARRAAQVTLVLEASGGSPARAGARVATQVPVGPFDRRLSLPATLPPGRYLVRVTIKSPGMDPATTRFRLVIGAPPEGVVSRAYASTGEHGSPRSRFSRSTAALFVHFRFVSRPDASHPLMATWYRPGNALAGRPVGKRVTDVVTTFVKSDRALPNGRWICVLHAGRVVVKRLVIPIG